MADRTAADGVAEVKRALGGLEREIRKMVGIIEDDPALAQSRGFLDAREGFNDALKILKDAITAKDKKRPYFPRAASELEAAWGETLK